MNNSNSVEQISFKKIIYSFKYWPRVFKLFWNTHKGYFIVVFFIRLLLGLSPVASLFATQFLINSLQLSFNEGVQLVIIGLVFFISVNVAKEIISLFRSYSETLFQTLLTNKANTLILSKANDLRLADFENPYIQNQLERAQQEANYRPYEVYENVLTMVSSIITIISSLFFLIAWKWWVPLLLLLLPLLSFISYLKLGQKEFSIHWGRALENRKAWYLTYLMTKENTFKEVKFFQLGPYIINEFKKIIKYFFEQDKYLAKRRLFISILFGLINLSVVGFLVTLVVIDGFNQVILIGSLVSYIQAITLTQANSQGIASNIIRMYHTNLYLEQFFGFLDIDHLEKSVHTINKNEKVELTKINKIEFKGVSFKYPGSNHYAINNVSFTLENDKVMAIVGENGSGKSTLIKLLVGLYSDYDGDILINDQSLETITNESIRKHISVVFQDFVKYELPARENIGFGDIDNIGDEQRVKNAMHKSGADSLIDSLPEGLNTQLGKWFENGNQLSGGEWQKIAITRGFMKDSDIVILDEPSAALDAFAEKKVFEMFKEMMKNRIGIYITHRNSSVRFADEILVLQSGSIVEKGTHQELLELDGVYKEMYEVQQESFIQDLEIS